MTSPSSSPSTPLPAGPRSFPSRAEAGWTRAEAGAPRQRLARIVREVADLPALLVRERGVVRTGVGRELRARCGTSALGWVFPLLRPLVLVSAYAFLFTRLLATQGADGGLASRVSSSAQGRGDFGPYLVVGVLVWSALAESLAQAAGSVRAHAGLVRRQRFRAELLPLQAVLVEHVLLLVGLAVFALVGLGSGWTGTGASLLRAAWLVPPVGAAGLVLVYGLALALAALAVVARDTQHALGVLLTLGMFATPVFWVPPPELLPGIDPWLGWIEANPLHQLLRAWRGALLGGEPAQVLGAAGYVLAVGCAALLIGHALFRHLAPEFADEV